MNLLLISLATVGWLAIASAKPADAIDAIVEIEKQRLVRFPDELDAQRDDQNKDGAKNDEAKRILEEINKINVALGYVKKQPGSSKATQPKVSPVLDSSQYLFPQPAYHPFHQQHHQMEGSHGETILVPSIRSIQLAAPNARTSYRTGTRKGSNDKMAAYNVPPLKPFHKPLSTSTPPQTAQSQSQSQTQQIEKASATQYFYRPNQVQVPAPQTIGEQQQLPTHFAIPVRLYRLNKAEYLQKHAAQEYRVKGYKIVGDIDNFYGKAKQKDGGQRKATSKYHLFFLPRELVLNEDATLKHKQPLSAGSSSSTGQLSEENMSREEKVASRPFKLQVAPNGSSSSSSGASAGSSNKNSNSNISGNASKRDGSTGNSTGNSTTANTQIIRKRIVPRPLRQKQPNVASQATPGGGTATATASTTIKITPPSFVVNPHALSVTPPPPPVSYVSPTLNSDAYYSSSPNPNPNTNLNLNYNGNANSNFNFFNRLNNNTNSNSKNPLQNNNATNVIKNAFQNLFKFPFRQDANKPEIATEASPLQPVQLQAPQKLFFNAQQLLPAAFYNSESTQNNPNIPNNNNNNYNNNNDDDDYWDNGDSDSNSNSNGGTDDNDNEASAFEPLEEKGIFANRFQQEQSAQREAIKQGGIVIQRLKVRKGGIAIAGPGGVATAGSGGTAIVGPGGYALTHPRSLTIAGPGAKIIAIPASIDLKDALQRTNLSTRSFPHEGKIVATGPTVYYAPETGIELEV